MRGLDPLRSQAAGQGEKPCQPTVFLNCRELPPCGHVSPGAPDLPTGWEVVEGTSYSVPAQGDDGEHLPSAGWRCVGPAWQFDFLFCPILLSSPPFPKWVPVNIPPPRASFQRTHRVVTFKCTILELHALPSYNPWSQPSLFLWGERGEGCSSSRESFFVHPGLPHSAPWRLTHHSLTLQTTWLCGLVTLNFIYIQMLPFENSAKIQPWAYSYHPISFLLLSSNFLKRIAYSHCYHLQIAIGGMNYRREISKLVVSCFLNQVIVLLAWVEALGLH